MEMEEIKAGGIVEIRPRESPGLNRRTIKLLSRQPTSDKRQTTNDEMHVNGK